LCRAKKYNQNTAYCQTKLANVLFTYELDRRLKGTGVTANCLYPGATRSNFSDGLSGIWALLWKLTDPFRQPPAQGAETPVYLASSPEVAEVSGKYFINKKPVESSKASYSQADAERLWQVSKELTKLAELQK
jgi:NAD(P)-dependent dehydrogenase (short-subunit alcohol dehydrogenase family)